MSRRDIDSLLNRGKHYVCQFITTGCYEPSTEKTLDGPINLGEKHLQNHDHRRVHYVIDHLFDYRNHYSSEELVEWVKYLVGGRRLPNNFAKEVKSFDTSSKCGLVWTTNFVAYRCRTCAISLCMSLCTDCFLNGNHIGHDFNMFRSQAGGACDCGDPFVMNSNGFCQNHQSKCQQESHKKSLPPTSLLCIAREIIPRLLYYLVLFLRENNFPNNKKANALLSDVLIYFNDLGSLAQDIVCTNLTNPEIYKKFLNTVNKEDDLEYQHHLKKLADNYRRAVNEIQLSSIFSDIDTDLINQYEFLKDIESFRAELGHFSFLDEIIFWTVLYEFPSNLITFLLKMLPDEEYKKKFAESFCKHYFRVSMLILHPTERFVRNADRDIFYNKLANAVVHVSVQLFSNENLALLLCQRLKLLYTIIISLKFAVEGNRKNYWGILVPNLLLNPEETQLEIEGHDNAKGEAMGENLPTTETVPRVVCCEHSILRLHRFWPIVSDLNNLFTHERIALSFLGDDTLIDFWLEFIMSFQAMNLNKKLADVDDDNLNYKAAYLSELEISASQMWTLVSHLKNNSTRDLTVNFTKHIYKWLQTWLQQIKLNLKKVDTDKCTFHLPLHRYYSVFLHHAATTQNVPLDELLTQDVNQLKSLLVHPLQTLIAYQHVMAGLWMSNGLQIKTQAINYMQPHFCNSTIDADVFLIQQVAVRLVPDEFVAMFVNSYGMKQYMYIYPISSTPLDQDKLISFLENAFTFIAIIVSQHLNLGLTPEEVTRKEMVALLSIGEKTHSQIQDMLPYKCGYLQNNSFTEILNDIAVYKSPEVEASGGLVQGYFNVKNQVWEEEFDPLFILYRNAYRRDFQTSLQRFAACARSTGKYTGKDSLPWPPFRLPPTVNSRFIDPRCILKSRILHAFYFSMFVKALNESSMATQHILSIIVYLMELTLIEASKKESDFGEACIPKAVESIVESSFENWFATDDIVDNFLVTIRKFQTCELKFESETFKSKFLANLFNSLIHEDTCNIFRDFDEYEYGTGVSSPTIIVENEDDDDDDENGSNEMENNLNFNLNEYFADYSAAQIEENCNYLEAVDEDENEGNRDQDEDESYMNVGSENMNAEGQTLESAVGEDTINQPSSSTSQGAPASTSAGGSGSSKHGARNKLCFSKTKPLRFEYDVEESFLTITLKLHSQLSGKRDSFKTDPTSLAVYDLSSRIGDGPYFVGCLLKRFILISARRLELQNQNESIDLSDNIQLSSDECFAKVIAIVDEARKKIWPQASPSQALTGALASTSRSTTYSSSMLQSSTNANHANLVVSKETKANEMDIDIEELERQEKKRRALELKQQIMNKFRTMQNAFMENNKEEAGADEGETKETTKEIENVEAEPSPSNDGNTPAFESPVKYEPKSYQCVICGVTGFSTLERSFVQAVLLQSSSILGNAQAHTLGDELSGDSPHRPGQASSSGQTPSDGNYPYNGSLPASHIPTSEEEQLQFMERKTFANYFEQRVDTSFSAFALDSWLNSFNIGWFGGVHVQSCGHLMHMDCFQSYISSVYQTRESSDLIEYSCPLCRKTANSVLPIIPNFANLYAVVKSRNTKNPRGVALEILELLSNGDKSRLANTTEDESKFLKVLAMAIEDIMKATEPQYRNIRVEPSPQSLFLFLSSISRTNLEYNILSWRDNLIRSNQQTQMSCFIHLFQALSLNAKLVLPMHFTQLWSQITGVKADDDGGVNLLLPYEKNVPLLLKDVPAILLHFLYALPFNIDKAYFISITQALLNLNFVQALVFITYQMSPEQRIEMSSRSFSSENSEDVFPKFESVCDYMAFIMGSFDSNSNSLATTNLLTVENQNLNQDGVQSLIAKTCLPFLRIASLLYHLLYLEQPTLPEYQSIANCSSPIEEFTTLTTFLNLNSCHQLRGLENCDKKRVQFFHPFISWIEGDPSSLINTWCQEFDKFVSVQAMAARSLIKLSCIITHRPRLLQLPALYDQLFMYYHKRTCVTCNTVPKDASICLICGRLVCIRDSCCRMGSSLEGVTHSLKCGAGTAIYLAINSSSIIVIRGRKACIWGSVYLDLFGEEDRDLKRGKPLYLCKERYRVLEQQWLTHRFSHISKKWVYHKDSL